MTPLYRSHCTHCGCIAEWSQAEFEQMRVAPIGQYCADGVVHLVKCPNCPSTVSVEDANRVQRDTGAR